MRISDWSSDVCSSDLVGGGDVGRPSGVNRSTQCSAHAMSARAIAIDLLAKLLDSGNKHAAGARARAPALTATQFKSYRSEERRVGKKCVRTCRSRLSP